MSALPDTYQTDERVLEVVNQANELVSKANALEIIDEASDAQAKEALAVVTVQGRELEKLRKSFVDPLNHHVKSINAFFKERSRPLDEARQIISGKVGAYFRAQQEAARKERERQERLAAKRQEAANKKAQAQGLAAAPPVMVPTVTAPLKTTATAAGNTTMRTVVRFEIVDESQLPRELLIPDEKKIKAMVDAKISVPGVRVYEDHVPVVRSV